MYNVQPEQGQSPNQYKLIERSEFIKISLKLILFLHNKVRVYINEGTCNEYVQYYFNHARHIIYILRGHVILWILIIVIDAPYRAHDEVWQVCNA